MSFTTTISADGASGVVRTTGTLYHIEAEGTFGGGTVTPQKKSSDGTWIALGSETLTADGAINVEVPVGSDIRANLASSSSPSIIVRIAKIR